MSELPPAAPFLIVERGTGEATSVRGTIEQARRRARQMRKARDGLGQYTNELDIYELREEERQALWAATCSR